MECVTTSSMKILWNGEPTETFKPSRGIRQGDRLSPYLFVLCMERLNQVIEESIIEGAWAPIRTSHNGPNLSNLFFADDIMLFSEANLEQAKNMQRCLQKFCKASGQKVSLEKSRVYFFQNVPLEQQQAICYELDIEATSDLGLYLGMPTGLNE